MVKVVTVDFNAHPSKQRRQTAYSFLYCKPTGTNYMPVFQATMATQGFIWPIVDVTGS